MSTTTTSADERRGEVAPRVAPGARLRGVWCATLTPIDAAGDIEHTLLAAHVRRLFAAGIDGVALFGTTGEGQSFSVAERRRGLEALLTAGIAPERVLVGTGCAALPDTVELTRHATQAGCAGALVVPPFFFKGVSAAGVYASYSQLIDAVGEPSLRLYLYHIPQVSGVRIGEEVIHRLSIAYPSALAGIKDSDGNLDHTRQLLARFPTLSVLVGHEPHLPAALAAGGAGTICGIANFFPRLMRRLHDGAPGAQRLEDLASLERLIVLLGRYPIFPAFKALQAFLTGDAAWERLRAPLFPLDAGTRQMWLDDLAALAIDAERDAATPH